MRLTQFTDYALRALLYVAAHNDRLVTIAEIQETFDLSKGHLMKIVQLLASEGYLEAIRGRSGGIRLGIPPEEIQIGALVRITEPDFRLVECFARDTRCVISQSCKLPDPLNDALEAFLTTLDKYTLADMMIARPAYTRTDQTAYPQRGPRL